MRLNVQHFNVKAPAALHSWLEKQLHGLCDSRQIDEAKIRLSLLPDTSPAWHVEAHLVTPGPDLVAESRDHTLPAAMAKVVDQLENQIASRTKKRTHKIKSNVSTPRATRNHGRRVN
ncbi:MAG TPA: HPF/RaiA family ribosome-associated protein [Methylomirabilota bacterium]|nr:HPF/RaiA family ribosome-associated protein [Methylomirabilota bacterium]